MRRPSFIFQLTSVIFFSAGLGILLVSFEPILETSSSRPYVSQRFESSSISENESSILSPDPLILDDSKKTFQPSSVSVLVDTTTPNPEPLERYLLFEVYRGRFGNQMIQLDWVYRIAAATNRTLVLRSPKREYAFIGMPFGGSNYSVWNLELLRSSPVKIHLHPTTNWTGPIPPESCTWTEKDGKFMASWAMRVNQLRECHRIIHFRSAKGIPREYRTDTREFGVDPLLFWKYVQFHPHIFEFAHQMLREFHTTDLGMHARTFREAGASQEKVLNEVCGPTVRSIPAHIHEMLMNRQSCNCSVSEAQKWLDLGIERHWRDIHMLATCDVSQPVNVSFLMGRSQLELKQSKFFAATDHNARGVVDKSLTEMGALMISANRLPIPGFERALEIEFALKNQHLVLDLAALILVENFVGVPVSSLTTSVCYWRKALGKKSTDMCDILSLRSYSPRCSESHCGTSSLHCCNM